MNIYLTLDYELFLGKLSGTVDHCLIVPMNELETIADQYNVKFTIFVDIAYLYRVSLLKEKESALATDYKKVKENIQHLQKKGHDIQVHFHPQWIYSNYINDKWVIDLEHYKLSQVPEGILIPYFKNAKNLLEEICGKNLAAFRAGGYSLESYSNYLTLFRENKIVADCSVLSGGYRKTKMQYYDYSYLPAKTHWNFSQSIISEDIYGKFIELPTTTKAVPALTYLRLKKQLDKLHANSKKYGDGTGVGSAGNFGQRLFDKFNKLWHNNVLPASIDGLLSEYLMQLYELNSAKEDFVIIGHPKNFTKKSLCNFERFLKIAGQDNFKTISQLIAKSTIK